MVHASRVVPAEEAATLLSEALGSQFVLLGPLAGGETGATAVAAADGRRFVLKWEQDPHKQELRRDGASLAERLRAEAGWPCPQQQVAQGEGLLLVLQEFMLGEPVLHLSHDLVDELFDLHERRLDLDAEDAANSWSADMIQLLVEGGRGYCLHEPLRRFDPRTRRIVERIEEVGRSTTVADVAGSDIVHGDLHAGNLLHVNGHLSAVIDMDYTRVGDAAFDLVMIAVSSLGVTADPGVRSRVFDRGVRALPEPKRHAYVANLLLRCLDWPIRKNRLEEVEFWIARADRLLPQ